MKGVTEIFISKEKLATFWFIVAVACLGITGWQLHSMAITSRGSVLYVPIDNSFYYLDRTQTSESRNELLAYHVRLALETYLNRGPTGPLRAERLNLLFDEKGMEDVMADITKTRYDFKNQQSHQLMEVGKLTMEIDTDLSAVTTAQGQVIRISVDPVTKEPVTQSFTMMAQLKWIRNPNLRYARRFAWVCNSVVYELREISSSEEKEK